MNFRKLASILFVFVLISCTKNTENSDKIDGTWYLVSASGGIAGITQTYPKGEIKWTFSGKNLVIENKYSGAWNVSFPSNSLSYDLASTIEGLELMINGTYYSHAELKGDSLILSQRQYADGFSFILIR